ncbi:hypothetical protein GCM10008986_00190 [Salinibacillus aidingensis]|uniref:Uncharacterized protein n=2 Tax=Salinibacillus aidingensis TaxID=237684 RepID=A0ABN1AMI1_9BACI
MYQAFKDHEEQLVEMAVIWNNCYEEREQVPIHWDDEIQWFMISTLKFYRMNKPNDTNAFINAGYSSNEFMEVNS